MSFAPALWSRLWKPGWRLATILVFLLLCHSLWSSIESRRFQRWATRVPGEKAQSSWLTISPAENAARYYQAAWALSVPERRPRAPRDPQAWLTAMEPAVEMLDRGAALPACEFSPHTRELARSHAAAKAISLRTRDLIRKGDGPRATASLVASLRYLRVFSADPPRAHPQSRPEVVDSFLTDAQLLIEAGLATDLAGVRERLDAENRWNHVEKLLLVERGSTLRWLSGELARKSAWPAPGVDRWLIRPFFWGAGASALELESTLIGAAGAPWPERIRGVLRAPPPRGRLARAMVGRLPNAAMGVTQSTARSHAMAVCLRLEEHRRAHGTLPDTLEALRAATGENELPVDPFTGQPLRYRREEGAYVVYSVGEDEKDDGGAILNRQGAAKDYGYRIQLRK